MYKVLKKSTAKVTARETVNKCEDTKYGAMAYAYLKECYNQEEDTLFYENKSWKVN